MTNPVLLIGGYGTLGAPLARLLRQRNRDLPLIIAGRNLAKAQALARDIGNASAMILDVGDLTGTMPPDSVSAIGMLVKDETLRITDFAVEHEIPLLCLSSAAFEIGPDVFHGGRAALGAPLILAHHWFAGGATIAALDLAARLAVVEDIEVGLRIDRSDAASGPATVADFERIKRSCPSTLLRVDGRYHWVQGDDARSTFTREDGSTAEGTIAVSCDVLSLAAATGAASVRVIESFGRSLSNESGHGEADEVSIRIKGKDGAGAAIVATRHLTAPRGRAPLTALTSAIILERLLGYFDGRKLEGGAQPVDQIFDPARFVSALADGGVRISEIMTV